MDFFDSQVTLKMLTVEAVDKLGAPSAFVAQFNPTSYRHQYVNTYQKKQGINTKGADLKFLSTAPESLQFSLILQKKMDRGLLGLLSTSKSVYDRVQHFLKLGYAMVGTKHAPRMLKLTWGSMTFEGALESANVKYTSFDASGEPTRAEIDVAFKGSLKDPQGSTTNSSPDLTHALTVKDWQTLPMITEDIYGDAHLYLLVAEANGVDHFRALTPGQRLHFPPTEKDESDTATE
jgi:hypothetical protein